jgi:hypothetical protein
MATTAKSLPGFFIAGKMEGEMEGQITERMLYKTRWLITRYMDWDAYQKGTPSDVPDLKGPIGSMLPARSIIEGNVLLNEGITAALNILTGAGANAPYNAGNARIGIGDSSLAANATQTGLNAASNKAWGNMANGYPAVANQTATWQAAFDANTANFGWQEFTIVNAANDTGQNLNRVANNQGTKVAGQVWTVSVAITLS